MSALAQLRVEGLDRRSWTVAEISRLIETGVIDEDGSFELWEGEIVAMQAKYNRHQVWEASLMRRLNRALPDRLRVGPAPSVFLGERTFLEPDIAIVPDEILPEDVRGPDLLLVIEVSNTSLMRDLRRKAELYARFGVRHYWVLDAERRRAFVHRLQPDGTYGAPEEHGPEAVLVTPFEPAVEVALARLG